MSAGKGRTFATISVDIWDNPKFRAVSPTAQLVFLMLISQRDLSMCGSLPLLERRWASNWADISPSDVMDRLTELEQAGLIAVDEERMEVLVLGFVDHDGILAKPNIAKAMWSAWTRLHSQRLATALLDRLPDEAFDPKFNCPASALEWFERRNGVVVEGAVQRGMFEPEVATPTGPVETRSDQGVCPPAEPFGEGFPEGFGEGFPEGGAEGSGEGFPEGFASRDAKGSVTTNNQQPTTDTPQPAPATPAAPTAFGAEDDGADVLVAVAESVDGNRERPYPRGKVPDIAIRRVFDHWVRAASKTAATQLTDKRRQVIASALEQYPMSDVLDAVVGWKNSEWHTGGNPDGKIYNDLELLLRNGDKIENFRDLARGPARIDARRKRENVGYSDEDRAKTGGRVYL